MVQVVEVVPRLLDVVIFEVVVDSKVLEDVSVLLEVELGEVVGVELLVVAEVVLVVAVDVHVEEEVEEDDSPIPW